MPFRLLSFVLRVVGSFFFVFVLQIQFDGKTLESYLNDFGKKFIVTKSLKKVSQDSVKLIRGVSSSEEEKSDSRQMAGKKAAQYFEDFTKKIIFPSESLNEKEKEEDIVSK